MVVGVKMRLIILLSAPPILILSLWLQTVVLKVGMSCQGCAGAVNRVLGKMEGISHSC